MRIEPDFSYCRWALVATLMAVSITASAAASPVAIELPTDRPLRAGFLLVDGVYNTELMAPWDVLEHARYHTDHPGIEVVAVAATTDPVNTAEGLQIVPDFTFDSAPHLDILVVPSAENSRGSDRDNTNLIRWVRDRGSRAQVVVSLCWGAFILAEAGLLDDRAATTFPADYDLLATTFPEVSVRINVSFVHDGRVLTSQGGARSYDVAMYLVELLFGTDTARGVGGGLLIEWPPRPELGPSFVTDPEVSLVRAKPAS